MDIRPNSYQADYWTGAAGHNWVRSRPSYDAELAQFGDEVLRRAAITTGERVLDVGCGTGAMTVQAAESAAPGGVVGLDISDTMLEAAIERARDAGVTNTTFTSADAQRGPIAGSPFDVVISRFGVMFFEDSTAAFANIGAATRPDGRLAFACWQAPEDNPWMTETNAAIAAFVESPSVSADAPGPFRFGDADLVRSILDDSGWIDVEVSDVRMPLHLAGPGSVDDAVAFWSSRPNVASAVAAGGPEVGAHVAAALRDIFGSHHDGVGVRFDSAVWSVGARRP